MILKQRIATQIILVRIILSIWMYSFLLTMDRTVYTDYREGDRYALMVVSDQIYDCILISSRRMASNIFRMWQ